LYCIIYAEINSTYGYDTLNRLNGLANSWAGSFGFGYDALNRRTSLTRPNGVNTSYSYDSVSHLLSVLHQTGATTLDGAGYTYDAAGNRTSKTNYLNGVTESYTYDPLYELTQVTQGASTTESYGYDAVGNRLSSLGMPSYQYNASNELTSTSAGSYSYDANGSTLTDAQGRSYTWDFENRMVQAVVPGQNGGTTIFKYDPFGRRIQKAGPLGTTNYLYDGINIVEERDNIGNVLGRYAEGSGVDQPLSEFRSGAATYYDADGLGSITSLTNTSPSTVATYAYDAFGNLSGSTGSLTNPFRYTSREFDSETGLHFYRTRYYDPSDGRFIREDPARFAGGINVYRYVGNSPTRFVDPYGLAPVNPQDMASLNGLFPGSTPSSNTGIVVPMSCKQAMQILEQNGFYSSDNWPSWNPFLFWDPIAHSGGWEFRKKNGMHIRMKYPDKPCDKTCTLDEAHNDDYNPMFDPWGHFEYELLPYLASQAGIPSNVNGHPLLSP
jgi:RHS repeat-associated protein